MEQQENEIPLAEALRKGWSHGELHDGGFVLDDSEAEKVMASEALPVMYGGQS